MGFCLPHTLHPQLALGAWVWLPLGSSVCGRELQARHRPFFLDSQPGWLNLHSVSLKVRSLQLPPDVSKIPPKIFGDAAGRWMRSRGDA